MPIFCIQGPDDGTPLQRSDCLEPGPGGTISFCAQVDSRTGRPRGRPVDTEIDIWAPDGSEASLYCDQWAEPDRCDGYIEHTVFDPAPDLCLLSDSVWRDYWRTYDALPSLPVGILPLPWEYPPSDWPPVGTPYAMCGESHGDMCESPAGSTDPVASRTEWCGGTSTDDPLVRYSCDYSPASTFPDTTLSQLTPGFVCPKQASLILAPDFVVPGVGPVASANAGVLGGAYCNLFAPRPLLGRLPQPFPPDDPGRHAPLTVFAVRDPDDCEHQEENAGYAEPRLDPGNAGSGQAATVLAGSRLDMTRDGDAGPPAWMPIEGEASVYFGPDGAFALTDFELHQANDGVPYPHPLGGTFLVTDSVLRMADLWAGVYTGPGMSPNVTLTAHASSTTMAFTFDDERRSMPLAPDRPPTGDFDGVDHLTLYVHYYDEPDQAQFDLTLHLRIHPRPTVVIDTVDFDSECRRLADGSAGSVLTASGHAAPGTRFWQLRGEPSTSPPPLFSGPMFHQSGTTATFAIPLGAPSDPPYGLAFTVLADGFINRDVRGGFAVRDTTGPVFDAVSVSPSCLWAPEHGYVRFRLGEEVQASVSDECSPTVRLRIANVVSDQLDNGRGSGSGNTTEDVIFGDTGFCLRAERDGRARPGRHYTVTLEASDEWGNVSTRDVAVEVRHDQRSPCSPTPMSARVPDAEVATTCVFPGVPPLSPPTSMFEAPPAIEWSTSEHGEARARAGACTVLPAPASEPSSAGLVLLAIVALALRRRRWTS